MNIKRKIVVVLIAVTCICIVSKIIRYSVEKTALEQAEKLKNLIEEKAIDFSLWEKLVSFRKLFNKKKN